MTVFLEVPPSEWVASNAHTFAIRDRFPRHPLRLVDPQDRHHKTAAAEIADHFLERPAPADDERLMRVSKHGQK